MSLNDHNTKDDASEWDTLPLIQNAVSSLHGETVLELIFPFLDTSSRMKLSVLNKHVHHHLWTQMYQETIQSYPLVPLEGEGPTPSKTQMDLVCMYLPPKIALVHTCPALASSKSSSDPSSSSLMALEYFELPISRSEQSKIYCDPRTLDDYASSSLFEKTRAVREYARKVESASTMYASLYGCLQHAHSSSEPSQGSSRASDAANRNTAAISPSTHSCLESAAKQLCSQFQLLSNVLNEQDVAMDKLCFYERVIKRRMHPMDASKARGVVEKVEFLGISPDHPGLLSLRSRYSQYLTMEGGS